MCTTTSGKYTNKNNKKETSVTHCGLPPFLLSSSLRHAGGKKTFVALAFSHYGALTFSYAVVAPSPRRDDTIATA